MGESTLPPSTAEGLRGTLGRECKVAKASSHSRTGDARRRRLGRRRRPKATQPTRRWRRGATQKRIKGRLGLRDILGGIRIVVGVQLVAPTKVRGLASKPRRAFIPCEAIACGRRRRNPSGERTAVDRFSATGSGSGRGRGRKVVRIPAALRDGGLPAVGPCSLGPVLVLRRRFHRRVDVVLEHLPERLVNVNGHQRPVYQETNLLLLSRHLLETQGLRARISIPAQVGVGTRVVLVRFPPAPRRATVDVSSPRAPPIHEQTRNVALGSAGCPG